MTAMAFPSGATVVLPPDAPAAEWHEVRQTGLGGSDIAAICGLNPYTSPLEIYLAKAGTPAPRRDDEALSEAAEMGHELEPVVARRFAKMTGLPVIDHPGTLRRHDIPWALVNLDRVTEEQGQHGAVELKTRSSYALAEWQDEVPVDVQIQVQWQLAVTGWTYAYTACLIGGQRTIVHRIDRDDQMIADLLAIGAEFWQWVQDRTPPPIDGSAATSDLLDRIHATANDGDIVIGDVAEVEKWLKIRATAKEQITAADIALTEADNHLKAICGHATEVHIRGELAYSWRPKRGQVRWKAAALAADPGLDPEPYRGAPTRTLRVHLENL